MPIIHPKGAARKFILPVDVQYRSSAVNSASQTVYTFSGLTLGPAASDRVVIVGVANSGTVQTVSSVTLDDGTGASPMSQQIQITVTRTVAIYSIASPTGTTGTVVVTLSGADSRCGVVLWSGTGLTSITATDTASDSASEPLSATLTVPSNGVGIGISHSNIAASGVSWTGLTEDVSLNLEATTFAMSGASGPNGGTITSSHPSSGAPVMVLAAFTGA